jgi:hypothetical protein
MGCGPAFLWMETGMAGRKPAANIVAVANDRGSRTVKDAHGRNKEPRAIVRWSPGRETLFVTRLAETANVAASIRASGLSRTSVYRRFRADPAFRERWEGALREGYLKLESDLLERALHGTEKTVWFGGKEVGTVREYNDRIALALLAHHRTTVKGSGSPATTPELTEAEMRLRFEAKLSIMNKAMGGAG